MASCGRAASAAGSKAAGGERERERELPRHATGVGSVLTTVGDFERDLELRYTAHRSAGHPARIVSTLTLIVRACAHCAHI